MTETIVLDIDVRVYFSRSSLLDDAIDSLRKHCRSNPSGFVRELDLVVGSPWLMETGPNYIAYHKELPVGLLAVCWEFGCKDDQSLGPPIPSSAGIFNPSIALRSIPILAHDDLFTVFGHTCSLFLYIVSEYCGKGIGFSMLSSNLPQIVGEQLKKGLHVRYFCNLANIPSLCLILKVVNALNIPADCYRFLLEDEDHAGIYHEFLGFLIHPKATNQGISSCHTYIGSVKDL
jgi:hypothetical protein